MTYAERVLERVRSRENVRGRPITLRELSELLDRSYEHCRKIVRGEPTVSEPLNREICRVLLLNEQEMWSVAVREKAAKRYPILLRSDSPDPQLEGLWPLLRAADKAAIVQLVRSMVRSNKAQTDQDSEIAVGK